MGAVDQVDRNGMRFVIAHAKAAGFTRVDIDPSDLLALIDRLDAAERMLPGGQLEAIGAELDAERGRNADLTARLDRERTLRITAEASLAAVALSAKADTTDCGEGNDVTACGVCGTCLRASRDYAVTQRANAEFARVRAEEDARQWEARVKLLDARAARAVDALQGRTDGGDLSNA